MADRDDRDEYSAASIAECEVCGLPDGQLCDDCAEDERERDIERAERLAEEDRFLYSVPLRTTEV